MAKGKDKYYQRPDGLYESIRTINGKRKAFRGRSCREVDRKILEYRQELERGRTVRQICDEWQRRREAEICESTRAAYKAAVKKLLEALGDKPVREIKPIHLERLLLQARDRGYKNGTIDLLLTICKQVFRYAVVQGDIDISPAAEIRMPRNVERNRRGSLTAEQIKTVTEYRGAGWLLGLMLLYTGCRRGELMALRYEDIDRKAGTISIRRKVNYLHSPAVIEDQTKTAAGMRTIPLLGPIRRALPTDRLGLIFHREDGGILDAYSLGKLWQAFLDGTGLVGPNGKRVTPHWMRHTFATICYDADVDAKSAAAMLGHADERITMEIYTHLTESRERASAKKLEQYVERETAEG